MSIFFTDTEGRLSMRLRCPGCSCGPVRVSELAGDVHAVFAACGAHERLLESGTVLVLGECRARSKRVTKRKS